MAWEEREKERRKNRKIKHKEKEKERGKGKERWKMKGCEDLAWLGLIGYRDFRSEKIEWFC